MGLDRKSASELSWELVPLYASIAERKNVCDILRNDRFTTSSTVSQRDFATVENFFFDALKDVDFVELSPLQPLGVNCVLANTSGKKLIPVIRGQEVNSDATTALAVEAYRRLGESDSIRLASNVRTVRPKIFSPESRFLPHFKVFAEVSMGRQSAPYGQLELDSICEHLQTEVKVLRKIVDQVPNQIERFDVNVSNLCLLRSLIDSNEGHKMRGATELWNSLSLPESLPFDQALVDTLTHLGFKKGLRILEMFLHTLPRSIFDDEMVHLHFDLSRVAGIDYYRHIAYSITATNVDGVTLPLADGGSTDWGIRLANNKQLYTVSSGVGTELLIQNLLELT